MRKRIERLFGEAKEQMGLRRARRRGLEQVREQCLMTAMAQNIKRIVKFTPLKHTFSKRGHSLTHLWDVCAWLVPSLIRRKPFWRFELHRLQ